MNNKVTLVVALIALVLGGLGFWQQDTETTKVVETVRELGASAGPEHTETQFFQGNAVDGGTVYATSSTASTYTLTTTELGRDMKRGYVSWTPNVSTTLTTMATTSAPLSNLRTGESYSQLWYNASTTAAATITFAAGTGVDLQEDEGGSVICNGLELCRLTFVKKADSDVILLVEPYQVGD